MYHSFLLHRQESLAMLMGNSLIPPHREEFFPMAFFFPMHWEKQKTSPFPHTGRNSEVFCFSWKKKADERDRTSDLRITNALLYQLSYIGKMSLQQCRPKKSDILPREADVVFAKRKSSQRDETSWRNGATFYLTIQRDAFYIKLSSECKESFPSSSWRQNLIIRLQRLHRLRHSHPERIRDGKDNNRDNDLGLARIVRVEPHQGQPQRGQTQNGRNNRTRAEIPRSRCFRGLGPGDKEFITKTALKCLILDLFSAKRTFFHII